MTATFNKPTRALDERALNTIFHDARTANRFLLEPVPAELLERIVETTKIAPTAMNSIPLRVVFVTTPEGRQRLKPLLSPGNVAKVESAPVTAILARDLNFHEQLPRLAPHAPQAVLERAREHADPMSLQNATLQAGYFILAARAHGLDAGPMGGFDNAGVDAEFFPDGTRKSILLVSLGYGDDGKLFPRNPRLDFSEIASFV
jgi:3-hydroxypropanoate dehydrogenase